MRHATTSYAMVLFAGLAMFFGGAATQAQIATTFNGIAVFETEQFATNIARGAHSWQFTNEPTGFTGSGFMRSLPVLGSNINTSITTTSPELQYPVQFDTAGLHYVWVRGRADDADSDSVHFGLNGSTAGALTWNGAADAWIWTNVLMGGGVGSITVGSTGIHTFGLWMREDGLRVDRVLLTMNAAFNPILGQAFHVPATLDTNLGGEHMRHPLHDVSTNTLLHIYSGNQATGPGGNPGNQLQTGSIVYFRNATNAAWTATNMLFFTEGDSGFGSLNKYYRALVPMNGFQPGDVVEYYLRIPYDTHLPTYLYGNDLQSLKSEREVDAQNDPFAFTVQWPLEPTGAYLAITNDTPSGSVEARIYTESGHLAVIGPDIAGTPLANTLNIAPNNARVDGTLHIIGEVLASAPLTNGLELTQRLFTNTVVSHLTFIDDGIVRYEVVDWNGMAPDLTMVTAPSEAGEHFYGFGEKFNDFDQAGRIVRIMTLDPPGVKNDQAYKVVPWFISTRGYGFHLDSPSESHFDMRATSADRYKVSNFYDTLAFNIVYGPHLTNVLSRFTGYTGRPPLPPAWAFAPWMSSDIWQSGGDVRFLITKLRERGYSKTPLVFDSPWETSYNDFNWNMVQFGLSMTNNVPGESPEVWPGFVDVADMMSFLRTNGFKAIMWMTPFINTNSWVEHQGQYGSGGVPGQNTGKASNYDEGAANDYFVRASPGGPPLVVQWWKGRGSPVDFTNPDARLWLMGQLSNLVAESGGVIGGFKTDDGEAGTPNEVYIPTDAVYFDGRTGVEMRNAYSEVYHGTIWNVLGTNGILFARSGFTGSQRYPGHWGGDNEPNFGEANGLPSVIVAGQSAAMSGYSIWGHDIGGYLNGPDSSTPSNLFMRWTQFGAFSPLMQMHRQVGSGRQYPWSYGPQAESNYVFYTRLHTALFPYIYSYAKEASVSGLPIIRPLVLLHQDDPNTYPIKHTYCFGNEFLVAPVITNTATTRIVYLPGGGWYDFWDQTHYAGGQFIVWTNANQSEFPLFVREGAIIPMVSPDIQTLVDPDYIGHTNLVTMDDAIEFLVYPAADGRFDLYDGSVAECQMSGTVVTFTLQSADRPVALRVYATEAPAGAERNGVRLAPYTNTAAFAEADLGWMYDDGFVHVKFNHDDAESVVRFAADSVGDGIPDSWRLHHFGDATTTNALSCADCDADDDGLTTWEEYRAGTDPNNPNSVIRVTGQQVVSVTNDIVISWEGQPGISYTVAWKDDLDDGVSWETIGDVFIGTGQPINWFDDGTHTGTPPAESPTGRRFYRIVVL